AEHAGVGGAARSRTPGRSRAALPQLVAAAAPTRGRSGGLRVRHAEREQLLGVELPDRAGTDAAPTATERAAGVAEVHRQRPLAREVLLGMHHLLGGLRRMPRQRVVHELPAV